MLLNSLKPVMVACVPFCQRERHPNLRALHLFGNAWMDREVARTLGMMKRLARKIGKIGHQIFSIPSPPPGTN
eukprot:11161909-Lingulodinium_polyedra.AAC.1